MNKIEKNTEDKILSQPQSTPYLQWKYKINEETGENELDSIYLSDGSKITEEKCIRGLQRLSGSSELQIGEKILKKIVEYYPAEQCANHINDISALLSSFEPASPLEALLLGQFLALNDYGTKCLRMANLPDQEFYHIEKLYLLAQKLLTTANQTIHTALKYRSGGKQTIQVVHLHNKGQAIVTQNLSPSDYSKETPN